MSRSKSILRTQSNNIILLTQIQDLEIAKLREAGGEGEEFEGELVGHLDFLAFFLSCFRGRERI